MGIIENLDRINKEIPENVRLVAVSKTKPVEIIQEAYAAGQRAFGENKAQDMIAKQAVLSADIEWHFIGHLQTNKVKQIVPFIELIESVDSFKLLKEINKQAAKINRTICCLLQFHIATEESKFGLDIDECRQILSSPDFALLQHIEICGVMGMATYTTDEQVLNSEFSNLKTYFDKLKKEFFADKDAFKEISMGMSGDYQLAIKHGSTNVRIGTAIFGARNHH